MATITADTEKFKSYKDYSGISSGFTVTARNVAVSLGWGAVSFDVGIGISTSTWGIAAGTTVGIFSGKMTEEFRYDVQSIKNNVKEGAS